MKGLMIAQLVYDKADPRRHVGRIEQLGEKRSWVRWHAGYASWVPNDRIEQAPAGVGYQEQVPA